MFTGIIEELGIVISMRGGAVSASLTVRAEKVLDSIQIGDSIDVNGVCLTVTSFTRDSFAADVMHETLMRSNLGRLHSGSRVNLERAVRAGGRFGGHIVSGHVDGTGVIQSTQRDGNAVRYLIRTKPELLRHVVEKGSIAVDGISLTVTAVLPSTFSVSLIPHTAEITALSEKEVGDTVNLETDCIGKYVEKFLRVGTDQDAWKNRSLN